MNCGRDVILCNEQGAGLVVILIATAMIVAAALIVPSSFMPAFKNAARVNYHLSATVFRNNLYAMLGDPLIWDKMKATDPGLACIRESSDCSSFIGVPQDLQFLYDPAGNIIFDAKNARAGFDHSGKSCTEFSDAGNSQCPFRIKIKWLPLCAAAPCVDPRVQIDIELDLETAESIPFDEGKYAVRVIK